MCGLVILRQRCLQRMLVALLFSLYPFCIAMGQFDLEEAPLPPTPPPQILQLASDDESASDSDADDSQPLDKEYEALSKVLEDLKKNDPARAAKLERELLTTIRRVKKSIAPATDGTTSSPIRIAPILPVPEESNTGGIRFEVAKQEFQLLRTAGDPANAARLEQQLVALEQGLQAGEYDFASSSDPEVHLVSLRGGSTLPKQYRTKENQYRLGFAEVHVRYRARPIILVLQAAESVLWKIKLDEGAQVYAIVTDSAQPQEIVGLSNPLVINSKAAIENGLYRPLSQFGRLQDSGIGIAGEYPVSEYKADKFDGEPIVLGASNKRWLSSYFVHLVEDLIDESRIVRRNLRLPAIKELRFTSTFISPSPFGPSGQPPQSNSGNFNIVGPIASSLRPLRHSQLRQSIVISDENENADEKEHLEFGLDLGGRLVVLQSTDIPDRLTPVPPPSNAVVGSASRFRTLAYDSSRNRLILATNAGNVSSIVCFDVEEAEWSKLVSLPHPVLAMTYVPAEDQIWAVVSRHQNGGQLRETADFLRIGSEGAIISEKRISEPLGEEQRDRNGHAYFGSMWDQAFPQLVEANNFALFVGTRNVRHPSAWSSAKPELFVIEPNSAELLYSGELKVNADEPVDASPLATTAATDSDPRIADSVLGSIHIKLDKAKSVLSEASATDEQQAKLEARLANIRSTMQGQELERTDERVYLIGRYASNQPIRIRVTDTTGPVTLVLSGYQSIDWQVEAAKGVNLTRIIAAGNQKQKVSSKPTETKVELYSGNEGFTIFDARDAVPSGRVAQRIRELTGGLEISAVAAAHQTAVHEMIVGHHEGLFRVQIVDRQLDRLLTDAVRSRSDGVLAELDAKRFFAVHQGALPRQAVQASQNKYHWSEFRFVVPLLAVELRSVSLHSIGLMMPQAVNSTWPPIRT